MPVKYDYDANANIIHAHPYAELSVPEILGYFDDLFCNSAIANRSIEVVHFDKVDNFEFSAQEIGAGPPVFKRLIDEKGLQATVFF